MNHRNFYRHKIENLISVGRIVTVHRLQYEKNYVFAGERHDFWEMVWAEENDVVCSREGGAEFPLCAGELLFHCPNEYHTIRANGRVGARVNILSFECKSEAMGFFREKKLRVNEALEPYLESIFREAENTFRLPRFDPAMKKLELRSDALLGGQQMMRTYLEQLLILLMRSETASGNARETFVKREEAAHLAQAVIAYLRENLYTSLSLDDLCRHFHYSRTYLCSKFKEATQRSIFCEYSRLKIRRAQDLLAGSDSTIAEISALLAFDTPAYFASTFKKFTGVTPREYRRSALENSRLAVSPESSQKNTISPETSV